MADHKTVSTITDPELSELYTRAEHAERLLAEVAETLRRALHPEAVARV